MNLGFDPSVVTELLKRVFSELREKRLWPVAVALLVAIVAVPVALSKSSSSTPVAQVPQPTPAPSAGTTLPALNVQTTPSQSRLTGRARNPFTQQGGGKSATTSTAVAATARPAAGATNGAVPTSSSNGTGGASSTPIPSTGGTTTTSPPPSITPGAKPTPSPAALTATQSYEVGFSITNLSGGLDAIDPLQRLSVLPSEQRPLLVELGVAQGGHSVLFVVQPGTLVNGPGTCTPGPIDCQILSLGQDQTEALSAQSPTGVVAGPLFAVTTITADQHPSAAAANKARQAQSAVGRALLAHSTLSALPLFQYEPSVGAVVDMRNLTVDGGQ